MAAHIFLTVVVAYGIMKGQKKYLPLAILAHAIADVFPALYQRGAVSMLAMEVWLWFWAVLLVIWARKLYKEMGSIRILFALPLPAIISAKTDHKGGCCHGVPHHNPVYKRTRKKYFGNPLTLHLVEGV